MSEHQRQEERTSTSQEAVLRTPTAEIPCVLRDISRKGAKIAGEAPVAQGVRVALIMEDFGTVKGEIVWTAGKTAGMKFEDDEDTIDTILIKLATYALLQ